MAKLFREERIEKKYIKKRSVKRKVLGITSGLLYFGLVIVVLNFSWDAFSLITSPIVLSYLSVCAFAGLAAIISASSMKGAFSEVLRFIFMSLSIIILVTMCIYLSTRSSWLHIIGLIAVYINTIWIAPAMTFGGRISLDEIDDLIDIEVQHAIAEERKNHQSKYSA